MKRSGKGFRLEDYRYVPMVFHAERDHSPERGHLLVVVYKKDTKIKKPVCVLKILGHPVGVDSAARPAVVPDIDEEGNLAYGNPTNDLEVKFLTQAISPQSLVAMPQRKILLNQLQRICDGDDQSLRKFSLPFKGIAAMGVRLFANIASHFSDSVIPPARHLPANNISRNLRQSSAG